MFTATAKANHEPEPEENDSVDTADMSVSSINTEDLAAAGVDPIEGATDGGFGLRGLFGSHGDRHRRSIQQLLPYIKEHLKKPGMLAKPDKENVKSGVTLALEAGVEPCWGPGKVYKSRRNCEGAILNIYFSSVVASIHQG